MGEKKLLFSNRDLINLIIPLIIEQLLAMIVGLADSIMIANVGESAVSGVSLVDGCMMLLINASTALATGGAVVAGQWLGSDDTERATESAQQLIWSITILFTAIMGLVYFYRNALLFDVFGKITDEVRGYARVYLLIVAASIPFIALYNGGSAVFRAMGDSKTPMSISIKMNIINVVGNAILIYGFHRGAEGVAIPTLVSRVYASLAVIILLLNDKLTLHIKKTFKYKPDFNIIKKILYIGVPYGMENSMFQLGKILVLSLVSTFGTYAIAANAVCNVLAGFQILPGMAAGLAVTTVISRCIGANDYEQARYYTKKLHIFAWAGLVFSVVTIWLFMPIILKIYNLSPEATDASVKIMYLHGICALAVWPLSFTLPSVFRAAGDIKFAMVVAIVSMWICRVVMSYVLGKYLHLGVFGIWAAMIMDWCARSICFLIRYKSGKWKGKAVV
ncbi:MAG: MATE family efflux transporter [Firmicutes bacterium]|nr:MATE family efflux transporter [Bacillota bacterium]